MGRFERRQRSGDRADTAAWVAALGDVFTLEDLLAETTAGEEHDALRWLYRALERGRIDLVRDATGPLHYRFTSPRRMADDVETAGRLAG
ncbi:MAG: hypothetical protein HZB46_13750 [Solirubrobacterales bacterium]|nr:hypothetical protein [Solirubrobacterales bacterium]